MRTLGLITFLLFFPVVTHAAIFINEVAWMGTAASANAEWMELVNTGDTSVDLAGWKLVAGNGSPSIGLAGSILPHGYFLLERTSDASVPSVTADQIYTGALTNTGTTLTLTDASGATIDQVDGGANWANIGGDNASKETAQRTSSGWETAAATPRAVNVGVSGTSSSTGDNTPSAPEASSTESVVSTTTDNSPAPATNGGSPEYIPVPTIRIITSGDRTVAASADTAFTAVVYDNKGNKRTDATVTWSFGDGTRRVGASVFHTYYESGDYVVVVHAKTPDDGDALVQNIITVKDVSVKISSVSSRGITLMNSGTRTLDLSLWRILMGGQEFKIPEDTHILAGHSVLFPSQVLGLPLADAALLLYPSGEVSASYPAAIQPQPSSSGVSYNGVQGGGSINSPKQNIQPYENAALAPAAATELAAAGAALAPQEAETADKPRSLGIFGSPWTLGFIGVMIATGGAFILL